MNKRTLMRIRKWVSLVSILSIISSFLLVAPVTSAYAGKDGPSWAVDAVDQACERELIDCTLADAKFNSSLDRAVGYQMLTKGFQVYSESANSPFADVSGQWFEQAAHTAYTLGWTVGVNGKFMGGDSFTRAQMAVATAAVLGLTAGGESDLDAYFDKNDVPSWAQVAMGKMVNAKLMGQSPDKKLRPNDKISKVEAIVVLNSSVTHGEDNGVDVLAVAAERMDVDADTVQQALDEGMNVVDGQLIAVGGGEEEEETPPAEEETPPAEEEPGTTTPVVAGSLTAALADDTPAAMIIASGTAYNKVLKINVTAGADADVKITGFHILRGGLSSNANVAGVGVYDAKGMRHGNIGTSWNDDNTMDIDFSGDPITVTKGMTDAVWFKVNLATGAMSGTLTLTLAQVADIKTTATLTGAFPLVSKTMDLRDGANTVAAVTVDAVQVHNNGAADATVVNVNLGTTRQHLATFRLANSAVEGVKINSITFYNNGSAADGDATKITLVGPDGTDLKTVDKTTNKYVTFSDLSFPMAKSASSKDFKIYADMSNGSTRTVRFLLQNDYDLVVVGDTSGAQILPTLVNPAAPNGNDQAFPVGDRSGANFINMVTISAGTLSFSRENTSPTGNVPAGGTGVVLGRWEMKATGEDMEIRQFSYAIVRSAVTNLAGTLYFKVREQNSTSYTTIYSVSGASADYVNDATAYTTTFVKLTAGKTYWLEAIGDILSTAANGLTYTAGPVDITQVKRVSTNDIVDPTVNPQSANTLTVKTGTLTVTADTSASAPNVVSGQSSLTVLGTWNFTAGSAEGISITSVVLDDDTAGLGRNFKELELWIDGAKRSQDTSSTLSPTATTATITFNVSPSYVIGASQTAIVEVRGKLISSTTDATVTMNMAALGVTGNAVISQSTVTVPSLAISGQLITISASGTLTVARDTVSNVKNSQMVAGTTNVTFGAFKLQTGNIEDVRIKKITVRNLGTLTLGLSQIGIYDGSTLLNDDPATQASEGIAKASLGADTSVLGNDSKSVTFDYTARPYVIAKNSSKILTVKANTIYDSVSGRTVQLTIDSIEAEGAGSNAAIRSALSADPLTGVNAGQAYAVGDVVSVLDTNIPSTDQRNTHVVATALASGAAAGGADALFDTNAAGTFGTLVAGDKLSKWNKVFTETVNAGATAQNNYAAGDVVMVADLSAGTSRPYVVTTAVAAGADIGANGTPVDSLDIDASDIVTRVVGGASEVIDTVSELRYNQGDVVVVQDTGGDADSGVYTVSRDIAPGTDLTVAGTATAGLIAGYTFASGRVTKLPVLSTEAVSTSSTFAYRVGDVVSVHDDSAVTDDGIFVIGTTTAVGSDLTTAGRVANGITLDVADRVSKLDVVASNDNLKRVYPTKLNFTWITPASATLPTGNRIELASFTMGADAANAFNPGATVAVTALNLAFVGTARLTNFELYDFTRSQAQASNANSSSFATGAAGGSLATQSFNGAETRTYKLYADVATSAGSQTSAFRFNAGNDTTAGTATWSVTNNAVTSNSTWTVLAGDTSDLLSTTLTSGAAGSDLSAPTVTSITLTDTTAADDALGTSTAATATFAILFTEKIDPVTVSTSLTYGGTGVAITDAATGDVNGTNNSASCANAANPGNDHINIVNIACIDLGNTTALTSAKTLVVTAALNAAGTTLTLSNTAAGGMLMNGSDGAEADGGEILTTVRDAGGNLLAASAWTVTSLDM